MAWNPHPKVADCREIARKWGEKQVIILAFSPGGPVTMASYGETRALCDECKLLADWAMSAVEHERDFQEMTKDPQP